MTRLGLPLLAVAMAALNAAAGGDGGEPAPISAPLAAAEKPADSERKADEWVLLLSSDSDPERAAAETYFLQSPLADVAGVLAAATREDDPALRRAAIALLHKRQADGVYGKYLAALGDADLSVRLAALDAIAYPPIADRRAVEPLVQLLSDSNTVCQRTAALLLGEIGDRRAAEPLRQAMRNSPDAGVRTAAVEALVALEGKAVLPELVELLPVRFDSRSAILEAVVRLGDGPADARTVRGVLAVLIDPNRDVRVQAIRALAALCRPGETQAINPLGELLANDPEPRVQLAAAEALGRIGDESAVELLHAAMRQPNDRIRQAAVTSLGTLGGDKALEILLAAMKDPDATIRERAASMLAESDDPRAAARLRSAIDDDDRRVAFVAVAAMSEKSAGSAAPGEAEIEALSNVVRSRLPDELIIEGDVDGRRGAPNAPVGVWGPRQVGRRFRPGWLVRVEAVKALGRIAVGAFGPTVNPDAPGSVRPRDISRLPTPAPDRGPGLRAGDALFEALDDPADAVVCQAALELGRLGDVRAARPLADILLKHTGSRARVAAGIALCRMKIGAAFRPGLEALAEICGAAGTPEGEASLLEASANPDSLSGGGPPDDHDALGQELAAALAGLADPARLERLIGQLACPDVPVRTAAAMVLGQVPLARDADAYAGLVESLLACLGDADKQLRRVAIAALGRLGDPDAVGPLCRLLSDNDPGVSAAAAEALGQIGSAAAVEPLIEALVRAGRDRAGRAQLVLAQAMGRIGDRRALGPLLAALPSNSAVAEVIASLGDSEAIGPLRKALARARYERDRVALAKALARVSPADSIADLAIAVRGGAFEESRRQAAETLGRLGPDPTGRADVALAAACRDSHASVRRAARVALAAVAGPGRPTIPPTTGPDR